MTFDRWFWILIFIWLPNPRAEGGKGLPRYKCIGNRKLLLYCMDKYGWREGVGAIFRDDVKEKICMEMNSAKRCVVHEKKVNSQCEGVYQQYRSVRDEYEYICRTSNEYKKSTKCRNHIEFDSTLEACKKMLSAMKSVSNKCGILLKFTQCIEQSVQKICNQRDSNYVVRTMNRAAAPLLDLYDCKRQALQTTQRYERETVRDKSTVAGLSVDKVFRNQTRDSKWNEVANDTLLGKHRPQSRSDSPAGQHSRRSTQQNSRPKVGMVLVYNRASQYKNPSNFVSILFLVLLLLGV